MDLHRMLGVKSGSEVCSHPTVCLACDLCAIQSVQLGRDIWIWKQPGRLTFEAASTAGANILKEVPHLRFGTEGHFHVHL